MPLSDFLRDEIIKHMHRTGSWTKPTTLAVCLCSQPVVSGDTGSLTGKELANSNVTEELHGWNRYRDNDADGG